MTDASLSNPDHIAASWVSPPGLGRCLWIGSLIGIALSFAVVTGLSAGTGLIEWPSAIGLGAFVAFWGGLGFGTMMGGVAYAAGLIAASDADERAATSVTQQPGAPSSEDATIGDRRVA